MLTDVLSAWGRGWLVSAERSFRSSPRPYLPFLNLYEHYAGSTDIFLPFLTILGLWSVRIALKPSSARTPLSRTPDILPTSDLPHCAIFLGDLRNEKESRADIGMTLLRETPDRQTGHSVSSRQSHVSKQAQQKR